MNPEARGAAASHHSFVSHIFDSASVLRVKAPSKDIVAGAPRFRHDISEGLLRRSARDPSTGILKCKGTIDVFSF